MDALKLFFAGIALLHVYAFIGVFIYRTAEASGGALMGYRPRGGKHDRIVEFGAYWPVSVCFAAVRGWCLFWFKWLPDWYAARMAALRQNLDASPPRAVARETE